MHTPRLSGQPINAGDLVFTWTASRPMRTSCENVGTVFPLVRVRPKFVSLARTLIRGSRMRAHKIAREHTAVLKGLLRIRRYNQQGTPYALQKEENLLL